MSFDFDTPLSLWDTHCSKYDGIKRVFGAEGQDVIPMWVADMDFKAAPAILDAARAEIERGYMGYFTDPSNTSEAISRWMARRQGWSFSPDAVRYTHGVIGGLAPPPRPPRTSRCCVQPWETPTIPCGAARATTRPCLRRGW